MTTMDDGEDDDPHDDSTHWAGRLPKTSTNSVERTAKCDTRGQQQSNVQRQESSMAKGRKKKFSIFNRRTDR